MTICTYLLRFQLAATRPYEQQSLELSQFPLKRKACASQCAQMLTEEESGGGLYSGSGYRGEPSDTSTHAARMERQVNTDPNPAPNRPRPAKPKTKPK